ncbi:hypothetical protein NDU88_003201 [Pleurodeles waltl]|uniref:Uncharacterized protein n=1 Tax=Pleurodeles waltl TaxID=8319 RepID=A0AAV7TND0_PLEWA|nr:hypothetical protein NDU88_003201 [Pleurodeles waltl]
MPLTLLKLTVQCCTHHVPYYNDTEPHCTPLYAFKTAQLCSLVPFSQTIVRQPTALVLITLNPLHLLGGHAVWEAPMGAFCGPAPELVRLLIKGQQSICRMVGSTQQAQVVSQVSSDRCWDTLALFQAACRHVVVELECGASGMRGSEWASAGWLREDRQLAESRQDAFNKCVQSLTQSGFISKPQHSFGDERLEPPQELHIQV